MEQKKKMHKGLLSIIVGVALCLSMLPATVFAEVNAQAQSEETNTHPEQSLVQTQNEADTAPSTSPEQTASPTQDDGQVTKSTPSSEQGSTPATESSSSSEQDATQNEKSSDASEQEGALSEQSIAETTDGEPEPNSILAAETDQPTADTVAQLVTDGNTTYYEDINEAFRAAWFAYKDTAGNIVGSGTATITLWADCDAPNRYLLVNTGQNVTFNLNGKTLTGDGTTSVIYVNTGSTLTLNGPGTITGGDAADNTYARGGGIYVAGTFNMNGGTITENTARDGGGVYVGGNGTFTMNGGEILSNHSVYRVVGTSGSSGSGGGVYVASGGKFNLISGTISGNGSSYGGGVFTRSGGTLTMKGGSISGNTAGILGGGVASPGALIMEGGEISGNTSKANGGGILIDSSGTITMSGGKISDNTAQWNGGGVWVGGTFGMTNGEISGNKSANTSANNLDSSANKGGGGVYITGTSSTFTMNGGTVTNNTAASNGGGICNLAILNLDGGSITGNHADELGGGIAAESMNVSGNPQVSGNTASAATITENVALAPLKGGDPLITLDRLTSGANIGVSVYQNSNGAYEYVRPTLDAPVQFTTAETNTSYYADSSQYFFSDREGYGVRANNDDKYLELAPAFTVTLHPQGGTFEDGTTGTKTITVTYGALYGELPTPTKQDTHFAAWSLSESDTGQHLHIGKDSLVDIGKDHDLYAHWQEKEVPEISFERKEYTYDGAEHPFNFTIDKGPQDNDWEIYYLEHTGDFHEKPTDRSEFSITPPVDADDYCIVVVHKEVTGTNPDGSDSWAYFESEFIHNGVIIKPATITVSGEVSKSHDGTAHISITENDLAITDGILDRDKGKVELVVADDANLTLHSSDAGTTGVGKLKGVYLTGDAAKNYQIEYAVTGTITENTNEYTLTFETNGGSVLDPVTKRYGSVVDLTSYTPTKEGYSFTGWYTDEALTDKIDSVTLTSDMTVYAGWEEVSHTAATTGEDLSEGSDNGSTLPLTGQGLQMALLLLALCALVGALILPFAMKRKKAKQDF